MPTLQQLGDLVGLSASPVSLTAVAQVFGISAPFSFKQVAEVAQSGNVPRPFYIVAHNPDLIGQVEEALDSGANAIGPDVNVFLHDDDRLCISHDEGRFRAPPLDEYLTELHDLAVQRPDALALVVFDCKEKVATKRHGATLLRAIRTRLTADINLNVIISVAKLSGRAIFEEIASGLGPREGLMIDEENDPIAVSDFFTAGRIENQCFGNGISVWNHIVGPNVRPSIERACEFRAVSNRPRFIMPWTVDNDNDLREYIKIGVDGIISNDIETLTEILHSQPSIRLATPKDNPFTAPNLAYGLTIITGGESGAGTDANVSFTLTGTEGSSSVTVNSMWTHRMERGDRNFVTLPSFNLGNLQSISVQRDNEGNRPDWFLDRILVSSFRYDVSRQANFMRWINTTSPFTERLV